MVASSGPGPIDADEKLAKADRAATRHSNYTSPRRSPLMKKKVMTAKEWRRADRKKKHEVEDRERTARRDAAKQWEFLFCGQVSLEGPEEGMDQTLGLCMGQHDDRPIDPPASGSPTEDVSSDSDDYEEAEESVSDGAEVIDASPVSSEAHKTRGHGKGSHGSVVLRPHDFEAVTIVKPHWCHNCGGIVVGTVFKCKGPCRYVCHHGLGKGKENCHADLLLTECVENAPRHPPTSDFGDLAKQLKREAHQMVKDQVVEATVEEQRDWGKFDLLKDKVHSFQTWWDNDWLYNTANTRVQRPRRLSRESRERGTRENIVIVVGGR